MSEPNSESGRRVAARAPSPPETWLFGHARHFQRDPLGFLQATAEDCGPIARLRLGPLTYHFVSEPGLVAEVLQTRAENYVRDTRSSRTIRLVTGESLLNAEGEMWRRHRRLAQPIFHQKRIAAFASAMAQAAAETATTWERAADEGHTLDLASEMSRLTFTAVGRCLFGAELGDQATAVAEAFPVLLDELFQRTQQIAAYPLWLPLPRHQRFKQALAVIDQIVGRIIAARRSDESPGDDLLGLLLAARDEDGSALSNDELRNQVVTFLLAGHETTASTLTWAFALLANNPGEREKVEAELDGAAFGQSPETIYASLPHLPRVGAVLQETLRLYPAIWIAERRVVATDELGGYRIPAGSAIVVAPYVTQRLSAWWPSPTEFRPDRFTSETESPGLSQGYFPFGAGPHACIGQHFAMMEAKIMLASLLARFRVTLVNETLPVPQGGITLRPAELIPIRVTPRRT